MIRDLARLVFAVLVIVAFNLVVGWPLLFAQTIVKADQQFYSKGPYIAYAAPWATYGGPMKAGADFADTITINPTTFPSRARIAWHWPLTPPKNAGVYGYMAASYGNYDGGVPQKAVTPLQVKNITQGWQSFEWSYSLIAGDFNLLAECFLTSARGQSVAKTAEVAFMLHAPVVTRLWTVTGVSLGTWTDRYGQIWTVSRNPGPKGIPYFVFMASTDLLKGTLDYRGAFALLKSKGQITGDEWWNGAAFGVEPITGSGSITISSWYVQP